LDGRGPAQGKIEEKAKLRDCTWMEDGLKKVQGDRSLG